MQNTTKPVALRDLPTAETIETVTVTPPALEQAVKAVPPPDDVV